MRFVVSSLISLWVLTAWAQDSKTGQWRPASESELKRIIPARAPVEKERIETETRTASGITDGSSYIAGVVLITAGYSAEGKYSHFLITQKPLKIGDVSLEPGDYVFGWQRNGDSLSVKFYTAQSGKPLGTAEAVRNSRIGKIESFHIYPPGDKSAIQIGRFALSYKIGG
jgi:hypothetical protein